MPIISKFNGISIKMYFMGKEHNPPQIHAICGDNIGVFSLLNGEMFEGDLENKERKAVEKFVKNYKEDLLKMWETQQFKYLEPIK